MKSEVERETTSCLVACFRFWSHGGCVNLHMHCGVYILGVGVGLGGGGAGCGDRARFGNLGDSVWEQGWFGDRVWGSSCAMDSCLYASPDIL